MKLVKIPIEAKQVVIGQKPRRGRPCKTKKALEYQSEADKEERVVSSIQVLKRTITEVEEETPQETEAEKVVQASTSSDINTLTTFFILVSYEKIDPGRMLNRPSYIQATPSCAFLDFGDISEAMVFSKLNNLKKEVRLNITKY
ncbi:hypothetical protein BpHYR1_033111 [Brachionus plicatilis]|uniref:Uncharacterized protein n=1 Tax=Brachionus plicatilis TaxID=10195 RepID=A0A3M7T2Z9_BRAPC|nr:hypothetical protein BpHYR1_033111 [Brachionus plicatilis]